LAPAVGNVNVAGDTGGKITSAATLAAILIKEET